MNNVCLASMPQSIFHLQNFEKIFREKSNHNSVSNVIALLNITASLKETLTLLVRKKFLRFFFTECNDKQYYS